MLRRRPVLWGPLVQEGAMKYLLGETQLYKPRNSNVGSMEAIKFYMGT
jgi:hypothetical protein